MECLDICKNILEPTASTEILHCALEKIHYYELLPVVSYCSVRSDAKGGNLTILQFSTSIKLVDK